MTNKYTISFRSTPYYRSVELRYELDTEYEGVPAVRFAANEWFLDNDEGCFCINVTTGITRENGCLLKGAMELYSCVGKYINFFIVFISVERCPLLDISLCVYSNLRPVSTSTVFNY